MSTSRLTGQCLAVLLAMLLTSCSSGPKPADWQLEVKGAMERSVAAFLEGNTRVEGAELARARAAISSTGQIDLAARVELLHCASHVASLVFEPCAGFEKLRQDAAPAERVYADYLVASLRPQDVALLPLTQQAAATGGAGSEAAVKGIGDPLSRLVALGVLFQTGRASPALVQLAVDSASAQGWRRPLMAWLGVQLRLAEQSGETGEADRLRRRLVLVQGEPRVAR